MTLNRITLAIDGLGSGGGGALTIERALARTSGVVRAYVSPDAEMAFVEYDPAQASLEQLVVAVERAGFRAGNLEAR